MTLGSPGTGCHVLAFGAAYAIDDPSEVALEDYARALTRSSAAEAVRAGDDPARVEAVHLCGLSQPPAEAHRIDIEAFARGLTDVRSGGLGWS